MSLYLWFLHIYFRIIYISLLKFWVASCKQEIIESIWKLILKYPFIYSSKVLKHFSFVQISEPFYGNEQICVWVYFPSNFWDIKNRLKKLLWTCFSPFSWNLSTSQTNWTFICAYVHMFTRSYVQFTFVYICLHFTYFSWFLNCINAAKLRNACHSKFRTSCERIEKDKFRQCIRWVQ